MVLMTGCSLFGLDLQEDYDRTPHTLSPYLDKTAWDYLKSRNYITVTDTIKNGVKKIVDTVTISDVAGLAVNYKIAASSITASKQSYQVGDTIKTGSVLKVDSLFTLMIKGIRYCGIDSGEYAKTDRTYVLMGNDAIQRIYTSSGVDKGKTYSDCFFGAVQISNKFATKWNDYGNKIFIKKYFEYLILSGQLSHYTLPYVGDSIVLSLLKTDDPLYFQHLPAGITQPGGTPAGTYANGSVPAFIDAGIVATPAYGSNDGTMHVKVLNTSSGSTADYPVQLNSYLNVRTSDLVGHGYDSSGNLVPNSVIVDVISSYMTTNLPL